MSMMKYYEGSMNYGGNNHRSYYVICAGIDYGDEARAAPRDTFC